MTTINQLSIVLIIGLTLVTPEYKHSERYTAADTGCYHSTDKKH